MKFVEMSCSLAKLRRQFSSYIENEQSALRVQKKATDTGRVTAGFPKRWPQKQDARPRYGFSKFAACTDSEIDACLRTAQCSTLLNSAKEKSRRSMEIRASKRGSRSKTSGSAMR